MAKEYFSKEYVYNNIQEKPTRYSFRDIEGQTFGNIITVGWAGINPRNQWWCLCNCGNYFKTDYNSLIKGLTTSCGCKYKQNGMSESRKSTAEAITKGKGDYSLLEYKGMRHPCKVKHNTCGKVVEYPQFYNFLHSNGCICINNLLSQRTSFYEERDHTFLFINDSHNHIVKCNKCLSKREIINQTSYSDCPCTVGKTNKGQYAVYVLESNKSLYKIGVSLNPQQRLKTFIEDTNNPHNLKIISVWWFYNKKATYHIESLLHRRLKDYRIKYEETFDGSTEYFECSYNQILNVVYEESHVFEVMKTEEPETESLFCEVFCYGGKVWRNKRQAITASGLSYSVGLNKIKRGLPLTCMDVRRFSSYKGEKLPWNEIYNKVRPNTTYQHFTAILRKYDPKDVSVFLDSYHIRNREWLYKGEKKELKEILKDENIPKWKYDKCEDKTFMMASLGAVPYWSNIPLENCY